MAAMVTRKRLDVTFIRTLPIMLINCVAQVNIHWVGPPQTILNKLLLLLLLLLLLSATAAASIYGQFLTSQQINN